LTASLILETMNADRNNTTCSKCKRTYSRPEHLQRHLLSHSGTAPYRCARCRKPFKRKDVLGRHLTICTSTASHQVVHYSRACQRCASKKRRCGLERPRCSGCQKANHECLYLDGASRSLPANAAHQPPHVAQYDNNHHNQTSVSCLPPGSDNIGNVVTEDIAQDESSVVVLTNQLAVPSQNLSSIEYESVMSRSLQPHIPSMPPTTSFGFLINFTKGYSLKGCFKLINDAYLDSSSSPRFSGNGRFMGSPSSTPSSSNSTNVTWMDSTTTVEVSSASSHYVEPTRSNLSHSSTQPESLASFTTYSPIFEKTSEIRVALRATLPQWSAVHEHLFLDFFSPDRMAFLLELYWSMWHPNWPVIHKPSFQIMNTPAPLLAAMMVVGACHGHDRHDLNHARYWFDAVEDLTFHDLCWASNLQQGHRRIQSIQAAFLSCIYQTWDGSETARARIRRIRFNAVVTAVRDLDMTSARHELPRDIEDFHWIRFIHSEESIRTLLWVFCLDTAYVIFNNMPPRFALRELRMGLASCEASFQASTPQECFAALQDWLAHNVRSADISLYGLIKIFFSDRISSNVLDSLAHESFMNLWCVGSAFHVVLFNLDFVFGGKGQFHRLRAGLDNWEAVWNQRLKNNDEKFFDSIVATAALSPYRKSEGDLWKRPGFWKNAPEYWLLAHLVLEHMESAQQSTEAADELSGINGSHLNVGGHVHGTIEDTGMRSLHSFLVTVGPVRQVSMNRG